MEKLIFRKHEQELDLYEERYKEIIYFLKKR